MPAEVTTAVCFDPVRGVAGIAGTLRGGRVVSIDITPCESRLGAHALALLRQLEITAHPNARPATFYTPSDLLLACLAGEVEPMGEEARRLVRDLGERLDDIGDKAELHSAGEDGTRRAYIAAKQGYKMWLAGIAGGRETWRPAETWAGLRSAA